MKGNRYTLSAFAFCIALSIYIRAGFTQDTTDASSSDRRFIHLALQGWNAEVKFGQLAAEKGSSDDVKQFGQKIVDDHTRLGGEMKMIAQQENIEVPAEITRKDKALEEKLRSLSGDAFDRAFIQAMVRDHRKDLSEFQKEAGSGNETSLRHAASQGAQVIGEHLQIAEQMAQVHGVRMDKASEND
ncbi:MAG: DUF4142 domain-containing protein [Acidobacteria bacterium]|nr:DUF4142 domain-containing protein [Acidobacteriota bacterium]